MSKQSCWPLQQKLCCLFHTPAASSDVARAHRQGSTRAKVTLHIKGSARVDVLLISSPRRLVAPLLIENIRR